AWILMVLALMLPAAAMAEEAKDGEGAPKVSYISLTPPLVGNYALDGGPKLRVYKADVALRVDNDVDAAAVKHHEPLIRNQLVALFTQQSLDGMSNVEAKEHLRQEALKQVQQVLNGEEGRPVVADLLFNNLICRQWQYQQVVEGAMLAFAQQRSAGQHDGQDGDVVDDLDHRQKPAALQRLAQLARDQAVVFVDDGHAGVVHADHRAGGGHVDGHAEGIQQKQQQHAVVAQAGQLLETEAVDMGQALHQTSCFFSMIRLSPGLGEGADGNVEEVAGREQLTHQCCRAIERRAWHDQPGELDGRQAGDDHGAQDRRDLGAGECRDQQPQAGGGQQVQHPAAGQGQCAALEGHAEQPAVHRHQQRQVDQAHQQVRCLLAEQELQARERRGVEVGDRAQLFFTHDAQRREHRGNERQDQRHHPGADGVHADHVLVVAKAGFKLYRCLAWLCAAAQRGELFEVGLVHGLHIVAAGFGAKRHAAIE
uniref:PHB domain-containing protein n=1 Tax=Steinernema glaseri TaxID=37863 RepID=A0A1I7YQR7_9BILA